MPECTTPLLRPVWWRAQSCSFSSTVTAAVGSSRSTRSATARPTMPPPMTTTRCPGVTAAVDGSACVVGGEDAGVLEPGVLDRAHLGVVVDVHDAEALVVAEGPLEVVHQAPREVAAHVGAALDRVGDGTEVRVQVGDPVGVVHPAVVRHGVGPGRPVL